jgi:hypothetical protein
MYIEKEKRERKHKKERKTFSLQGATRLGCEDIRNVCRQAKRMVFAAFCDFAKKSERLCLFLLRTFSSLPRKRGLYLRVDTFL